MCNRSVRIYASALTRKVEVVKKRNEKSYQVQAFCEERGLTSLLGVIWYAESKNQCWQAGKWLLIELICIFLRWPPKNHGTCHVLMTHNVATYHRLLNMDQSKGKTHFFNPMTRGANYLICIFMNIHEKLENKGKS